ncbi:HAMP domain-containing sensor histidine kinase [Acaryochloris sp. IP29b_bin.148]|uniref:sensor histidine kinase n=1 Tax=Acaryochloris sp. IP29b_bin.148 TaxID=2969218 RepID=UPI0026343CE9|nr:HAMP domain-containing sensor histidine kinase [Acaryochloris sp. IP29b_bin.148]
MLFEQTTVGEFLQQTLVCGAQTPIQEILDLLQHQDAVSPSAQDDGGGDGGGVDLSQLVVVNAQQQPISLIPVSQFIHLFFAEQPATHAVSPQQPITEWEDLHNHPLQCVAATDSLKQFWQYLQTFSQDLSLSWAIVEAGTGQYLGLLDTPKLVQFLAHHAPLSVAIKFSSDLKSSVPPALALSDSSSASINSSAPPEPRPTTPVLSAELLAEISHELKSPLTAVLSLSNVLSHQGIQNLSERQLQYVQLIHQKSQQLMGIVNTLLDLTQLPSPTQPGSYSAVNLDLLCADAIAQAKRHYLQAQGISDPATLSIQYTLPEQPGLLATHERKLRQILVHLLCNALNLTQGASTVQLRIKQWQGWVIFTIQDQGACIPASQQPFIFQLPQAWTHPDHEQLGKTGLGLILAQRFAEQLFGDITFMSGPERGNRFSVYVPTEAARQTSTACTRGLILIIATEPALIDQLHQHLSHRSLQTVIARLDQDALQKIARFNPQAILLQTTLTTGETLTTLRQCDRTPPILLMGNEADDLQALKTEADGYLNQDALTPGLDQWLDQWLDISLTSYTDKSKPIDPSQGASSPIALSTPQKLTALHLDGTPDLADSALPIDINSVFYDYQWRVVSTTTLEEAEWLASIWQPNIILYTAHDPDPLLAIAPDSPLVRYPFVILCPEVQQMVHQRSDLNILTSATPAPLKATSNVSNMTSGLSEVASLLQVLNNLTIASE